MADRMRTLLVEDEDDIRFVVELALAHRSNFDLTSFASGVEALEALSEGGPSFDLALVNLNLPAMSGATFAKRMASLPCCADTPVIFVTASLYGRDEAQLRGGNSIGVITKPFDAVALPDQIRDMLEQTRV
ncbi:response regulator [Sphingomonas montanisoli]|nr:response regulator [Sphingomonas montanisoli]